MRCQPGNSSECQVCLLWNENSHCWGIPHKYASSRHLFECHVMGLTHLTCLAFFMARKANAITNFFGCTLSFECCQTNVQQVLCLFLRKSKILHCFLHLSWKSACACVADPPKSLCFALFLMRRIHLK